MPIFTGVNFAAFGIEGGSIKVDISEDELNVLDHACTVRLRQIGGQIPFVKAQLTNNEEPRYSVSELEHEKSVLHRMRDRLKELRNQWDWDSRAVPTHRIIPPG